MLRIRNNPIGAPLVAMAVVALLGGHAGRAAIHGSDAEQVALNDLEKQFADRMANTVLVGRFTVLGRSDDRPPTPERYEIESVTKVGEDDWTFVARLKYGNRDVKLPITLKVMWAGDTPMISLTDLTVPMLGTFTARVIFYADRYAGTWQHGNAGGHLFGTIEKAGTEQ